MRLADKNNSTIVKRILRGAWPFIITFVILTTGNFLIRYYFESIPEDAYQLGIKALDITNSYLNGDLNAAEAIEEFDNIIGMLASIKGNHQVNMLRRIIFANREDVADIESGTSNREDIIEGRKALSRYLKSLKYYRTKKGMIKLLVNRDGGGFLMLQFA